jgi:hypothetical protein
MAESEEVYLECFIGLFPMVILSGHSFNLVQPFCRSAENKLQVFFFSGHLATSSTCSGSHSKRPELLSILAARVSRWDVGKIKSPRPT